MDTMLTMFAIVAAVGLVGLFVVETIFIAQDAAAVRPPTKGCRNSLAVNESQGKCFRG